MNNSQEPQALKRLYAKVPSDSADDLIFRNHSLLELANLYFEKCDFPNAVDCLEKVRTEALQFHLYENYFEAVWILLRIHTERLEQDKVESLVQEVLQLSDSLPEAQKFRSKIEYNQGIYFYYAYDYAKAKAHFIAAKEAAEAVIATAADDAAVMLAAKRDQWMARFGLATVASAEMQLESALEQIEALEREVHSLQGEPGEEDARFAVLESTATMAKGNIYRRMGELQKALDMYWKAHGQLKSQKVWCHYYYVLLGLGRVYLAMEDMSRATIFFDLISDAVNDLELYSLKELLEKESQKVKNSACRLVIDRERKVVIEKEKGEVHFERRFILLEILYLLASEPGKIFTKDILVDRIWKESYNPMIHDSKVYTSISRLRKLIEPDFKRPRYILNERDGYSFNPAIKVEELGNWRRDLMQSVDRSSSSTTPTPTAHT